MYGLRAGLVAQRRREFGIRLALGASRGSMLRQVVGEGGRIAAAGIVIGALLAAALASYLPARRALKVEPIAALRVE